MLPPLTSQLVSLIKDTSLVSAIAVADPTMQAQVLIADTFLAFEIWLIVAALYLRSRSSTWRCPPAGWSAGTLGGRLWAERREPSRKVYLALRLPRRSACGDGAAGVSVAEKKVHRRRYEKFCCVDAGGGLAPPGLAQAKDTRRRP